MNVLLVPDCGTASSTRRVNVWGIQYVDELLKRDRDADNNSSTGSFGASGSGLEERLFAIQDANWNVVALVDGDNSHSTDAHAVERFVYDPYGEATVLDANGSADADGQSDFGWVYLHQAGRLDPATGLYDFRHRAYSPTLGRWMQQDPAGYVNGTNVYVALVSSPVNRLDPLGLDTAMSGGVADHSSVFPMHSYILPNSGRNGGRPTSRPATCPASPPSRPRPVNPHDRLQSQLDVAVDNPFNQVHDTLAVAITYGGGEIGATLAEGANYIFNDAWFGKGNRQGNAWKDVHRDCVKSWRKIWHMDEEKKDQPQR